MQIALDVTALVARLVRPGGWATPGGVRYAAAITAMLLSALGVYQAMRVPPLKDVEIAIPGLPPQFDGYKLLQLTDPHISRLFPKEWTQGLVERSNALGVDLIAMGRLVLPSEPDNIPNATGDLLNLRRRLWLAIRATVQQGRGCRN